MTLTEKFGKSWKHGIDCRIAAFRNSLACEHVFLSNPMALGLSGVLVFCFNDGKRYMRSPFFALVGMTDQSLEGLATRLNCHLIKGRATEEGDIARQLAPYLSLGLPVHAGVKRFRLKQLLSENDDNPATLVGEDNGFHYITLTAYDEASQTFDMFDTDTMKLHKFSKKDLEEVWFYDLRYRITNKDQFQSCDGQWFCVKVGSTDTELIKKSAINAIDKVLLNFFDAPMDDIFGIKALKNFQEFAQQWSKGEMDPAYFLGSLQLMYFMETPLSGGGFGRKLYGYFLRELSELLADEQLKEVSISFSESARAWKKFISHLMQSAEGFSKDTLAINYEKVKEAVDLHVDDLVDRELTQMTQLSNWLQATKH